MQSCSSAVCVLILLVTFTAVSESAVPPVKVKLHDSATLPCYERCSGLVRWTVFHKPTDVLAECNQTCRSVKEGYQMIHDQYLKGDFSLTITDADLSKRGAYTCDCDGKDLCDVELQVKEPEKQTDNKGDNEGPSSDGGQGGVSTLTVVLVVVVVVAAAGVGGRYWFRSQKRPGNQTVAETQRTRDDTPENGIDNPNPSNEEEGIPLNTPTQSS